LPVASEFEVQSRPSLPAGVPDAGERIAALHHIAGVAQQGIVVRIQANAGIHGEKPGPSWISLHKNKPPRIIIGPNAQVDGPLVFEREVVLYVHSTAKVGSITGAKAIPFSTDTAPGNR